MSKIKKDVDRDDGFWRTILVFTTITVVAYVWAFYAYVSLPVPV